MNNADGKQMIASDIINAFDRIIKKLNPKQDTDKIKRAREIAERNQDLLPIIINFFLKYIFIA